MCIYSHFQYLCLHQKLKIVNACDKAFKDARGVLTCPNTPNTHNSATFGPRTYGLGVCDNIHCAWKYSILPIGDYGNEKKFGKSTSFEDDTEIEDSLAAREERVGRWFTLLNVDQQLDHFQTQYPIPEHELSDGGRMLRNFPQGAAEFMAPDTLSWQELNPLYLNPAMLQWCVCKLILPASVVDDRKSETITPRKPIFGPFRVPGTHNCPKRHGICKVCGTNIGNRKKREKVLSYRQNVALRKVLTETPISEDLKGGAWDPNMDLKWDDAKGEYLVVPANFPVNIRDAPYPASSNPSFVPSATQAVDTAAVFGGQNGHLADSSTYASAEVGLTGGQDWDSFVMGATLDDQPSATFGSNTWSTSGFLGYDGLPTMSQSEADMNNFSFDASASFGANHDTTYNINTANDTSSDFGLSDPQFDSFTNAQPSELDSAMYHSSDNQNQLTNQFSTSQQTNEQLFSSTNHSEHGMLFSNPDPVSQDAALDFNDDSMMIDDSGEDQYTLPHRPSGM